jgi:hypothetical protein
MVTEMPLAVRVPFTVGSDGASLGPVGLPLHPSSSIPAPLKMASVTACAQNVRRVGLSNISFILLILLQAFAGFPAAK